jgi:hypothetical protein
MRVILESLNGAFVSLDNRSRRLLEGLDEGRLFVEMIAAARGPAPLSSGECIVRSAAKVEQTFGGITTRLWDDPFEWTLPERLADKRSILQYLDEVAQTRTRGMAFIGSDSELGTLIQAPVKMRTLREVLTSCLDSARKLLDQAEAVNQNRLR